MQCHDENIAKEAASSANKMISNNELVASISLTYNVNNNGPKKTPEGHH